MKSKGKGKGRSSKEENRRYTDLTFLEAAGHIKNLKKNPVFYLYTRSGKCITRYTPDSSYTLCRPVLGLPIGTDVVEEYKSTKKHRAYTRPDYAIYKKWIIADYDVVLIENIGGKLSLPKCRYPKVPRITSEK